MTYHWLLNSTQVGKLCLEGMLYFSPSVCVCHSVVCISTWFMKITIQV